MICASLDPPNGFGLYGYSPLAQGRVTIPDRGNAKMVPIALLGSPGIQYLLWIDYYLQIQRGIFKIWNFTYLSVWIAPQFLRFYRTSVNTINISLNACFRCAFWDYQISSFPCILDICFLNVFHPSMTLVQCYEWCKIQNFKVFFLINDYFWCYFDFKLNY